MRLRATVRSITGATTHVQGTRVAGELGVVSVPDPKTIEITEQAGAIYLLRLDSDGECLADTWHESVKAAKEQAKFEYGVEDGDWEDMEPPH
jgi:hypothetical protein